MRRFRRMKTPQEFTSVHASFHSHFNQERNLVDRKPHLERRSASQTERQAFAS